MKKYCILVILLATPVLAQNTVTFVDQGYTVNVVDIGKGRPVLLVHGLGVSRSSFEKLAVVMSKSGYRVLLPDIPGQGTTARDEDRSYSIDSQAHFLKRLLDYFNIDKSIVIGNSMGGHIAFSFGLIYPERVKSLVLISPAGLTDNGVLPYPLLDLTLTTDALRPDWQWNNHIRIDIQSGDHYPVDLYLPQLSVPTLIVWGDQDQIIDPKFASIWQSKIEQSKLKVLAGFGHIPQNQNAQFFYNTIRHFLKDSD
ncbi:MAG: alpha/beta hydrolase [Leptonema sp. (in: Bacteria)]|nr:alpha/beta hydrolase [Leptonema sp. (in: bacteria)]